MLLITKTMHISILRQIHKNLRTVAIELRDQFSIFCKRCKRPSERNCKIFRIFPSLFSRDVSIPEELNVGETAAVRSDAVTRLATVAK